MNDGGSRLLVRVEEAGLGTESQVRLVVSGLDEPARLRGPWSSSGATVELVDGRLHATSTVAALARAAGRSLPPDQARQLDRALRAAVTAWGAPAPPLALRGSWLGTDRRPVIVGVVNVTPDSFSDGGLLYPEGHPETALAHARALLDAGADVLDVGGESTRPGSDRVDPDEELRRVVPVLEGLADLGAVCSIDTSKPAVAEAALEAGASIVNDVTGARDPGLLGVAADHDAGYVLMHTRGDPADMQQHAAYDDVVGEVYEFLADGLARCTDAGIGIERIAVDPGVGFAKTAEHNLALLRALRQFRGLGRPVLVGVSRKSFLGEVLGGVGPEQRLEASLACATVAALSGVALVRVHDVTETTRALRAVHAVMAGAMAWPPVLGVAASSDA